MAKKVFFSFHYQDVIDFRANVVRNHGKFKLNSQEAGYFDSSMWEKAKKESNLALKRLINNGLKNTSNTCVLIGDETFKRPWVRYEIFKSFLNNNHLFAVHINGIKCKKRQTKNLGKSPFDYVGLYAKDKDTLDLVEYKSGKWYYYTEIDSKSSFSFKNHGLSIGDTHKFSKFFPTYKWNKDDGFNNFKNWVK